MSALITYEPPELPPTLQRQVDHFSAGPTRYPGDGGGADLVLAPAVPSYHPDAQAAADAMRPMSAPADHAIIATWLLLLAGAVDWPPADKSEFHTRLLIVELTCGELPRVCWTAATLKEAAETIRKWPSVAQVNDLLKAYAERWLRKLDALDRIARAGPPAPPARASTLPYDPGPLPAWAYSQRCHPSMPTRDPADVLVRIDPAVVARQLTELGYPNG